MNANAEQIDVWLGTSSRAPSKGIYHCLLETENGRISPAKLVAEIEGPGFLAMHPKKTHLYSTGTLDGVPSVTCYKIAGTGRNAQLELVNSVPIGDGGASHVSVDPTGRMLLTAQYGGGSVASYQLASTGEILKQTELINHQGGSRAVARRQDSSHAHWTGFSPDLRFAFVPDLGLDQVVIYSVNLDEAKLTPHGHGDVPPGAGPRHMKFHPNGNWIYVLNELSLSVSVFDYDAQQGVMRLKQTIPTVDPAELAKEKAKSCSEIRLHPNGKYVYAANRGHDTITAFRVESDGRLTEFQNEPVRGATPRNFALDPSGHWLLVGGQASDTLACFEVDADSGKMTFNQTVISTPSPICVLFGSN